MVHVPVVERFGLGHIEVVGAGILCSHMVHTQAGEVHILAGVVHTPGLVGLAGMVHIRAWLVNNLVGMVYTLGLAGMVHTEVELWRRDNDTKQGCNGCWSTHTNMHTDMYIFTSVAMTIFCILM